MPKWDVSPQGSAQWLKARCGMLTASKMADAMAFLKNGTESEARRKLKINIVAERLTDTMCETSVTPAMQWGMDYESDARNAYECKTGNLVELCGFALHDDIEYFGASPDGLVGTDGLIEIKCPTTPKYIEWRLNCCVPEEHKPQMLAQLAVTGRKWCDFVAYDPRLPEDIQLFIRRFEPSVEEIKSVEDAAIKLLAEVDKMFEQVVMF